MFDDSGNLWVQSAMHFAYSHVTVPLDDKDQRRLLAHHRTCEDP